MNNNVDVSLNPEIDVILICLNDEEHISKSITQLRNQKAITLKNLIVVDGGSHDETINIIENLPCKLVISEKGMLKQTKLGLNSCESSFVFLAECDHDYYPRFLVDLYEEFSAANFQWDCLGASNSYIRDSNFFEKGHKFFSKIHSSNIGSKEIVAGAQLWKRYSLHRLMDSMNFGDSYCFDTARAEVSKLLGLKLAQGRTEVVENYPISYSKFISRHRNYGYGDYDFYHYYKKRWTLKRRFRSISHIFVRYVIKFPLIALRKGYGLNTIVYFWLVACTRYFFWLQRVIKK